MSKVNFCDLNATAKSAVFWLADEAEIVTASVINSASHTGEIWAAAAFMKKHPKGTSGHIALAERLRLGEKGTETILDCIRRSKPGYLELAESGDEELDALLADLKSTPVR